MGTVNKSSAKKPQNTSIGGPKQRSAETASHAASRVEPSKLKQKERDVREQKAKARGKKN